MQQNASQDGDELPDEDERQDEPRGAGLVRWVVRRDRMHDGERHRERHRQPQRPQKMAAVPV